MTNEPKGDERKRADFWTSVVLIPPALTLRPTLPAGHLLTTLCQAGLLGDGFHFSPNLKWCLGQCGRL